MATSCINIAILSGEVGWLKIKYTKDKKTYVNFGVKQDDNFYDEGRLVSKGYKYIPVNCFESWIWKSLKEGDKVTVEAKIVPYTGDKGDLKNNIEATKITIHSKSEEE